MMIMPSSSSSSSSSSAAVQVDKATSDLLIAPDWTLNIEICDSINSNHWQAKDVIKAVKKRLQHKSSSVQLLALTLLETMVKNCGDYVHFHIVDRNILQEMVKIVRKKADVTVRNKVLVLLDSWQEAFGGPGGKYPQYYWTYEELRQSGVQFPKRTENEVPIFTPPAMHPPVMHAQPSYGMPSNASTRLDQAMATETESLSMSCMDAMELVVELLTDMLREVTPGDREAVKDELIVDLVDQCRSNQKRLMQMLTSTGDEELLGRGLELNDNLQSVLGKHDAIASGTPQPMHYQVAHTTQAADAGASSVQSLEKEPKPTPVSTPIVHVAIDTSSQVKDKDADDDEEDDFAQLARRHSKNKNSQTGNAKTLLASTSFNRQGSPSAEVAPSSLLSNALVLADPPPPLRTTKDQDMIDLLSLALTTTSPHSPAPPAESTHETSQVHPNGFEAYSGQVTFNDYVAPWAQPQPQSQTYPNPFQAQDTFKRQQHDFSSSTQQQAFQPQQQHGFSSSTQQQAFQTQHDFSSSTQQQAFLPHQANQIHQQQYPPIQPSQQQGTQSFHPQNVPSQEHQRRPPSQSQIIPSSQYPQNSQGYIPPPWAATPGYYNSQRPITSINSPQNYDFSSNMATQPNRPQQYNSGSGLQGDTRVSSGTTVAAPVAAQKPFIPSYRLFEDLDVFGNTDGRIKGSSSGGSPSLPGSSCHGMVGGNK